MIPLVIQAAISETFSANEIPNIRVCPSKQGRHDDPVGALHALVQHFIRCSEKHIRVIVLLSSALICAHSFDFGPFSPFNALSRPDADQRYRPRAGMLF